MSESRLTPVAPDVWQAHHPLSFYGLSMTACMTVVRLASGGLWIHSPIALSADLKADLDRLGPVEYIVAPNRYHHLFALACLSNYPAAQLYAAKGLAAKNAAFAPFPVIPVDAGHPAPWSGQLDSVFVKGNAEMNETVFFHRPSRTLIITDLAVHLGPWDTLATRLYARINGCYDRLGQTLLLRSLYRDRKATRGSLDRILAWDFVRVVPAHGPVIEHEARAAFEQAFAWLLRSS